MHLKLFTKNQMNKLTAKDITLMALMVAVIEVSKIALANIPNVEITSFWIIMFALYFGNRIYFIIPVFILIEGAIYGFGTWWVMYLYAWPLLAIVTRRMRNMQHAFDFALLSGIFGLLFGMLCAIPYVFILGPMGAVSWWVAGIPFDLIHGIANFTIMFILYKPMKKIMLKASNLSLIS